MTTDPPSESERHGGLPALAALAGTLALSVAAGWLDLRLYGNVGLLVSTVFVLGFMTAVLAVATRGVLLVMLSTPLVAILAIVIVVIAFTPHQGDSAGTMLALAKPVILHFPAIAGTTALVVATGVTRLVQHRRRTAARAGS
ncbi:DUF6542 domain-containing protein [Amycolatopsis alkalitolerans]|uniref:DUF6542 domain-containing protein n=1 Tax=Amycolatopsis alkalitolerans TaxID=2547244 RepID=A0A5C4LS53_9PSEU|nr:DUF6542 domain-containing protein [Amycolatopsis alkalitolerans]TNC21782.1 hypothetical protein FG385_27040 [Amycolatopsis alkalitolerans]